VWICISDIMSLSLVFPHSEPQKFIPSCRCGSLQTAEPQVSFHVPPHTILGLSRAAPER
jgi:hypothetical protein